jgi:hypothetical protein
MAQSNGQRTYKPALGTQPLDKPVASEATLREIDLCVRDIVADAFDEARAILTRRRGDLDKGAEFLLTKEQLLRKSFRLYRRWSRKKLQSRRQRLRSDSCAAGWAVMEFGANLALAAEKHWRRLDGQNQIAKGHSRGKRHRRNGGCKGKKLKLPPDLARHQHSIIAHADMARSHRCGVSLTCQEICCVLYLRQSHREQMGTAKLAAWI